MEYSVFGYDNLSQPEQQALAVFAEGLGVAVTFVALYILRPGLITGLAAGVTLLWTVFGIGLFLKRRRSVSLAKNE